MRWAIGLLCLAACTTAARAEPAATVRALELGPMSAYPGALAVSRDGRIAAHVDATGAVKVWEVASAQPLPGLPAGQPPATSVALNADGSALVVGHADGRLVLWKRSSPTPLREFRGHSARILAIDVAADGRRVASGSEDGTSQVFDLATGRRLHVLDSVYTGHPVEGVAAPVSVAFAAQGRLLVVQDWQRRQYDVGRVTSLWDAQRGIEVATVEASPPGEDEALQAGHALGGNGWLLAYTGMQQLMVQRLDGCAPPRPVGRPDDEGMDTGRLADTVAADPLGRWIAAASGTRVRFFAAVGGRPPIALELPGHALALTPLPDGRSLLAVLNTSPRVFGPRMTLLGADAPPPVPAHVFRIAVPAALLGEPLLRVAADARPCPIAEAVERRQQFLVADSAPVLAVAARLDPALPTGPGQQPLAPSQRLRFDARGQLLALYAGPGDTRAAVAGWALATGQRVLARELPQPTEYAALLWLGTDWALEHDGGWLRATTGQALLTPGEAGLDAQVAGDSETGRLYRIAGSAVEQVAADGSRAPALQARGPLRGIAAGHGRLLVVYRNGDQELFAGSPLASQLFKPYQQRLQLFDDPDSWQLARLALSADGRFAHASMEPGSYETPGFDSAWRISDGMPVYTGFALAHLPAKSNRVITADARAHRLAVWDFDRNEAIARLPRQRSRDARGYPTLLKAAISDDGRHVASGSPDGLVRVWDIDAHQLVGEVRVGAEVTALAFDAPGRHLAVGRAGGEVWVLNLP